VDLLAVRNVLARVDRDDVTEANAEVLADDLVILKVKMIRLMRCRS
jgi:hypothetical protein